MLNDDSLQRYAKGLYAVALLLICVPVADILLRSLNAEAGSLQWRFGTVGLLFGNLGTILLGLGVSGLVAALTGSRPALRAVGFVAIALAVVVFALMALFALDALQMRRLVAPPIKRQILVSSASAGFSAGFGMIALLVLGRAALVASRQTRAAAGRGAPRAVQPLVMGGQGATSESA
ncbi:hypothetical protein [Roseisolibacter sp. H3M3-2]|uniref:hypothetical protein n=1 Tax=Roseisolibacter sp. H3M3-2 TaxID=3031323 RepID=UPI0023DA991B|nr:hypothetical protein [Roseisolibacter sp. H3M3-2]MDF1502502.1 hypothetical protein [Roseisolibacter sp. H3M3-2]